MLYEGLAALPFFLEQAALVSLPRERMVMAKCWFSINAVTAFRI